MAVPGRGRRPCCGRRSRAGAQRPGVARGTGGPDPAAARRPAQAACGRRAPAPRATAGQRRVASQERRTTAAATALPLVILPALGPGLPPGFIEADGMLPVPDKARSGRFLGRRVMEFQDWTLASKRAVAADRRVVGAAVAGRVPQLPHPLHDEERSHRTQPLQPGQAQQRPAGGAGPRVRPWQQTGGVRPAVLLSLSTSTLRLARQRATTHATPTRGRTQPHVLRLLGGPHLFNGRLGGERAPGRADDSAGLGGAPARRHLHRRFGDLRPGELRSRGRFTP